MEFNNNFLIDELQRVGKVGIFNYDIKNDVMTISDITCELLGISNEYMRNKRDWLNIVHLSQREEFHLYFEEIINTGKDFNKEYRIARQNEEIELWIEVKGKVYFDEHSIPKILSGTIHDISELKKSEERYKKLYMEFQEKEALLVSLINSIPDMIYYKDINGVYLGCNKALENFVGMNQEDIIGCTDYDIFEREIADSFRKMDLKMIHKEEHFIYEEWVKYPNGRQVLCNTLKTPYYDSQGNILGSIGVSRDITGISKKEELQKRIEEKRKRVNELKEADRIKTEFFVNISHELRTPINVIFSATQMEEIMLKSYLSDSASEDNFKYVKMMKQNCYRLLRLIENLIDITKFENGYYSLNRSNHDIISLIEEVVSSVAGYIENKDISIIFDTDVEEKIIALDPEKIERIILNLLSNSVKFTPSGGSISVKIQDHKDNVCIKIKDTGSGIPEDKLESIFDRFVQVDKSLNRSHEGSGIGLSIVKSLVEQHGGKIFVKSKESQGTEFILHLPCELVESIYCKKITSVNQIGKSSIEKVNIEFSDIL
ncbi:sensor histidine kinase [Clostridium chromiireducens]|uniref:histidine kinase n=1 Tax=Clostridium chromiireducens TaxID=225345 RepID=A0A1V4ITG0_9CLOT|nr:PAS domain-containing hybrid sensor histidine kinase/response regulator [Clostridium chromiireducens]OPJ63321.1 aerobic respiration control sensor protein ArcB [Clostridium chromiireducens]